MCGPFDNTIIPIRRHFECLNIYQICGCLSCTTARIACSITCPTSKTRDSPHTGHKICSPTGKNTDESSEGVAYPTGILSPGSPASDAGIVKISSRYSSIGSATFCPIFHATCGAVGVSSTSTDSNTVRKSQRINSRTAEAFL